MTRKLLALVLMCVGCGGTVEPSDRGFACTMGDMTSWRSESLEQTASSGSCGVVPQELLARSEGLESCDVPRSVLASECASRLEYECPTGDGAGTQEWVLNFEQVSAVRIEVHTRLQIWHASYAAGYCVGEYDGVMAL